MAKASMGAPAQIGPTKTAHQHKWQAFLQHTRWEQMVAGLTGGTVTTAILHPLDLAKIRLQVNEGCNRTKSRPISAQLIGTLKEVYTAKGFRGLYQGVSPNLLGNAASWGLYFFFYGSLKNYAQDGDPTKKLSTATYLGMAYLSGVSILWMTNPIWVVKTRMCLQYETVQTAQTVTAASTTIRGTLTSIWRAEGVRGLYRGMVPGMVGVSNGAVQFLLYEKLRNFYNDCYHKRRINAHLAGLAVGADARMLTALEISPRSTMHGMSVQSIPGEMTKSVPEYLVIGTLSKALAVIITYPYQVVRTRLQEQHRKYGSISELMKILWRHEGYRGFYKGLLPNVIRTAPACGLTFVVYENCCSWLNRG